MANKSDWLQPAFEAIAIDDEGRACLDIPDSACQQEAGNFFIHVGTLTLTKSADGLIDPKLVLSWLMTNLGAPAALIGLLVPVREAGALLPQMFTAGWLRALPQRKWAWAAGSAIQGLSAIAIAIAGLTMEGAAAGWTIITALLCLALARSICSVCYKDVLGKTIDKSRRGTATGLAGSISAGTVIVFALLLTTGLIDRMTLVLSAILVASGAWILASALFSSLKEYKGATEGGRSSFKAALENLSYLKTEPQLRRFIAVRGLLTATALSPPYMVAAASTGKGQAYEGLGLLVFAGAIAGLVSSFVWGKLSDRSSRKVLILAAGAGFVTLGATVALLASGLLGKSIVLPVLVFMLMIAYQGVRLGRSTHLVDMADAETRAPFTALSNTIIGILLLLGGIFSLISNLYGAGIVLTVMAVMCALAVPVAWRLNEVQS